MRGRCRPNLLLSVLLIEPYLSPVDAGARPEGTEGCPSPRDRPDGMGLALIDDGPGGTGVLAGCSKMFLADIRDEVGVFRLGTDCLGVLSSSVGFSNMLPNGDPLTGVVGIDLTVRTASATSPAGAEIPLIVSTALTVSMLWPEAAAFASLLFSAFALALASLSSVA
jgi:hypothetical protein